MTEAADPLEPCRARLTGLAYRMLGSRADAEDVVQDAYLRYRRATDVGNAEAFFVTTVTRLCIDRLKSARAMREVYVGPWLPEPVLDDAALSPQTELELADDISFALMLVLERLPPAGRAAFLLRDVFDLSFSEIASILDKSETACRQLASRARRAVRHGRPVNPASRDRHAQLLAALSAAIASGDAGRLASLLQDDAVLLADGGGLRLTARNPISGAVRIARYFVGVRRKFAGDHAGRRFVVGMINGNPGIVFYFGDEPDQAMTILADRDRIAAIYIVRNPRKLAGLRSAGQDCSVRSGVKEKELEHDRSRARSHVA